MIKVQFCTLRGYLWGDEAFVPFKVQNCSLISLCAGQTRLHHYIPDPGGGIEGEDLPRRQWTLLNRLRTGVGCFKASMKKWGLTDSTACECGEPEQTANHIITACLLHRPPSEEGLFRVGPEMRAWLHDTMLDI